MRRILPWMAVVLLLIMPIQTFPADRKDGSPPGNPGDPGAATVVGAWDGSVYRMFKTDNNGILRVTEEYGPHFANPFVSATAVSVTTGLKMIGNGWSVPARGDRVVRIRRVATIGSVVDPCYLYLFGSDDGTNFFPVSTSDAWRVGSTNIVGDSSFVDTLSLTLPSSPAAMEKKITIPSTNFYAGRYIAVWARRDSSATTLQTLSVTFEGTAQ